MDLFTSFLEVEYVVNVWFLAITCGFWELVA